MVHIAAHIGTVAYVIFLTRVLQVIRSSLHILADVI